MNVTLRILHGLIEQPRYGQNALKNASKAMAEKTVFYRRNLPHIQPATGIFFITFRLTGSLPKHVLHRLKEDRERGLKKLETTLTPQQFANEKYKLEKRYFAEFDQWLHKCTEGPLWLKDDRLAQIVASKIHDLDQNRYHLVAYCIMANHVHLVIELTGVEHISESNVKGKTKSYLLADTLRLLKGSTSRLCNIELSRTGAFWHHESYDHYVRDEAELGRIVEYVLNDPVRSGLVQVWQDWKFSYFREAPAK